VSSNGLRAEELRRALVSPSGPFAALDVVSSTGSTNADLIKSDAPDRTVLIAEQQTEGRGRRDRQWMSPPSAGVYLSVLLRPEGVPVARLGTLAMVAGLALVRAARESAGVDAVLKWPNDLLVGEAKCAGVLSEAAAGGSGVVVGVGLNVDPLPVDVPAGVGGLEATSLAEAGASNTDRTELAAALLTAFASLESAWRAAGGDLDAAGLLDAYRNACATIGQRVTIELPDGSVRGTATGVEPSGELLVKVDDGGETSVSAGDVVHLRTDKV
jgi:BirA family transcriptional regulator, biotin operon repressor / biotin---[acetyl-CoA-carboxylase] ligase